MRFFIIPIGWIYRNLRRGASKILGEDGVQSLENDVTAFIDEVYEDTVGDLARGQHDRETQIGGKE